VIALAERGKMLHAPDVYMDKIAVGPGYPTGIIDLAFGVGEPFARCRGQGLRITDLTACIMDTPAPCPR
jgi:fructose-1,6-bisphosphatase II / sedoheptulose-1,7-bisphosphatase